MPVFKDILSLIDWKHFKNLNLKDKDCEIQAKVILLKKPHTTES